MRSFFLLLTCIIGQLLSAQSVGDRTLVVEEMVIPGMPGVQSFAWGQHNGEWLMIGGRTDGLHRFQPPFSFLASDNNVTAYVVDPLNAQVWSASLSGLPTSMFEQLQSTNMPFAQRDSMLYVVGGYGYSASANDHITHPYLCAIHVPGMINAIKNGQSIIPHVRQVMDPFLQVTGGQLGLMDDQFFLVGGQRFMGRYNPMGPNQGPGFEQQYTNAIRRFTIDDNGVDLIIADTSSTIDTLELHRRDYNMLPQIFPDGAPGFTVFSGVFQYAQDLPWLNTVDVTDSGYVVVPGFEQLLNQYHTAHLPVWDSTANIMRSIFFGGISRYFYDQQGVLWDDQDVPFVNTISMVERDGSGVLQEVALDQMPALLGSGAEFIPSSGVPMHPMGILRQHALSGDTVLAGYIVGGIESTAPNIFFSNNGTQSDATGRIFKVLLVSNGSNAIKEPDAGVSGIRVLPGHGDDMRVEVSMTEADMLELDLLDSTGRRIRMLFAGRLPAGEHSFPVSFSMHAPGVYFIRSSITTGTSTIQVVH
ncbi:MAG: hypothetical protein KDB88_11175 [Flavobacteriales bacterium]|nr:hypothetical protein [Flavobacteriales bacterium]